MTDDDPGHVRDKLKKIAASVGVPWARRHIFL